MNPFRLFLILFALLVPALSASDKTAYMRKWDGSFEKVAPGSFTRAKAGKTIHNYKKGDLAFNVIYNDDGTNFGFDDPAEGQNRKNVMAAVFNYISDSFGHTGSVDVLVDQSVSSGQFLASGAAFVGVPGGFTGFLDCSAQKHIIEGIDDLPGTEDIRITVDFSSSYYTGSGTPGPGEFDLFTVLLHEVTHGLGFTSASDSNGNSQLTDNVFYSFESMLFTGNGDRLWDDFGNVTVSTDAFVGNQNGVRLQSASLLSDLGAYPNVYAPNPFSSGSSLGHLDTSFSDSVMQHALGSGVVWRTYSAADTAVLGALGYTVSTSNTFVYTWVSNSTDFESTIIVNNYGSDSATINFNAIRANGDSFTPDPVVIPARGFFQEAASSLFDGLGPGGGFTVKMTTESSSVTGRWVTNDRPGETPSQGIAPQVPANGNNDRVGNAVMLGYLPGNPDYQSAPVVTNVDATAADIRVRFYDANGSEVNDLIISNAIPFTPYVVTVVGASAGDQYAVAQSDARITGVVFVFNSVNQTAIGNGTTLNNYSP